MVAIGIGRGDRAVDAGVDTIVQVEADGVLDRGAVIGGPTRVEHGVGSERVAGLHEVTGIRIGVPANEVVAALGRRIGRQALQHAGAVGRQRRGRGLVGKLAGVCIEGDGVDGASLNLRPLRVDVSSIGERVGTRVDLRSIGKRPVAKRVAIAARSTGEVHATGALHGGRGERGARAIIQVEVDGEGRLHILRPLCVDGSIS